MDPKINQETLINLVNRLEMAANKLEAVEKGSSADKSVNISSAMLSAENIAVFSDFWNKTLTNLLGLKKLAEETKKPETLLLTEYLIEGLCFQQDILIAGLSFKKPQTTSLQEISKKFFAVMTKCGDMKKEKRDFALQCDAVKSGLESLCWMFQDESCDAFVQTYAEAIEFPANKLFMEKIPEQTAWVKALKMMFKEVIELVKANYKKGINWSLKGEEDINKLMLTLGNTLRKNFKKLSDPEASPVKQESDRDAIKEELTSGKARKSLKKVNLEDLPKKVEEPKVEEKKVEVVKKPTQKPNKGDPSAIGKVHCTFGERWNRRDQTLAREYERLTERTTKRYLRW